MPADIHRVLVQSYTEAYMEFPPEDFDAWAGTEEATTDDRAKLRPPHTLVPVLECGAGGPPPPPAWAAPVVLRGFPPTLLTGAAPSGVELLVGPGTHWLVPRALAAHVPPPEAVDPEAPFTQLVFGTPLWGHVHVAALESQGEVLAYPLESFLRVPGGPLPAAPIPQAASLSEGLARFGARGLPFVVRDATPLFPCTLASLQEFALGDHTPLWGYDRATGAQVTTTTAEVTAAYLAAATGAGDLTLSVLDAPVPLPPALLPSPGCPLTDGVGVALVVSPNPNRTKLHVDPAEYGGGWMFLLEGRKQWLLVAHRHLERLVVAGPDPQAPVDLADAEAELLPRLIDAVVADRAEGLPGPGVWEAVVGPGSLLYFPLGTAHKVLTSAPSFGLGGYMLVEGERGQPQKDLAARMVACRYV